MGDLAARLPGSRAAPGGATTAGHRDRRHGTTAAVSALPTTGDRQQARAHHLWSPWHGSSPGFCGRRSIPQRRHSHRPTTGAEPTCRAGWERAVQTANDSRHESEDRRDSCAVRTTVATRVLDCTSSRRTTVMHALPQTTGVITEYQRDSSSKRPPSFVVWAARPPTDRLRASGNRRRAVRNIEVRQEVIPYQLSPSPWSSGDIARPPRPDNRQSAPNPMTVPYSTTCRTIPYASASSRGTPNGASVTTHKY